jgi:hypothetical protein
MSTKSVERWKQQLVETAEQLAQVLAGQLHREQQGRQRCAEQNRILQARRRSELGAAVEKAGLSEWNAAEIVGVLLEVKDRIGLSRTQRMAAQKRGELHLGRPHVPAPDKPSSPDATNST